jgi:hypothetical protein
LSIPVRYSKGNEFAASHQQSAILSTSQELAHELISARHAHFLSVQPTYRQAKEAWRKSRQTERKEKAGRQDWRQSPAIAGDRRQTRQIGQIGG